MANTTTKLNVSSREPEGSRAARRLRRTGRVPGVLYGGGGESVGFDVDARELRIALAGSGAVLDLSRRRRESDAGGAQGGPARPGARRDRPRRPAARAPRRGDPRRRAARTRRALDDAPGVKEGGVLEQITRELNVEALPTAIPESIVHDVGEMEIGETIVLAAVAVPEGVTLLDDAEETSSRRSRRRACRPRRRGNRGRDRARRRGRRGREAAPRARRRGLRRRGVAAPATPLRRRRRRSDRLADRRARQPGPRVRRARATTSASSVAEELARALGADAAARTASARAWPRAARRRAGDRRSAGAARWRVLLPADLHERRRALGRPGARRRSSSARARARRARRDRPAVRRGARAHRRRPGGPQRPEVAQARARQRATSCACASASGGPTRPTRRSSRPTCSAASARPRSRCGSSSSAPPTQVERVVLDAESRGAR